MKNEIIQSVAQLVARREIIDHDHIRCLHSPNAVREIESADKGCWIVGTGSIGDDGLAKRLEGLTEEQINDLNPAAFERLEDAYRGPNIGDYCDDDKASELAALDRLIAAARALIAD